MLEPSLPRKSEPADRAEPDSPDAGMLRASIVHDFNNLLTPIINIMSELQRQQIGTPRQLSRIDGAIFCAFRAKTLARQLLDLSPFSQFKPEAVDLHQMLTTLETAFSSVLRPSIDCKVEVANDLPPALIDRELMERALLNLVLNGRDAMPDGGTLTISAAIRRLPCSSVRAREPMICLSVTDTGFGISPATLDQIAQGRFSTKVNGTGLGLAMVRNTMERHGGSLSVSSAPTDGTIIDLWLPVMHVPFVEQPA